jgi:hypothetical protein
MSHIFEFLHHYLDMSHLPIVHKFLLVTIYLSKCQIKISCMCCQITRRVCSVPIRTSRIQLLYLQLRTMTKEISLFSTTSFNQFFRDLGIGSSSSLLEVCNSCLNQALQTGRQALRIGRHALQTGVTDWMKRSVGGWIDSIHIRSNLNTSASSTIPSGTP